MISPERRQALYDLWVNETIDDDSWFYDLIDEEQEFIYKWDAQYETGLVSMARDILELRQS